MKMSIIAILLAAVLSLGAALPLHAATVNVSNGNLYDDYQVSPASQLSILLSYNSRSNRESLFGYGWNADFDIRLLINSNGSVVLIESDGREELYQASVNGAFTTPAGVYEVLSKVNGEYWLQRKDGDLVTFSAAGNPTVIQDRNGNRTTYGYDGEALVEIIDPGGKALYFTRDGKGRITAIADQSGRTSSFAYDAAGNLIAITNPAGQVRSFTYDAVHNLTGKTDPAGNTTRYSYDSDDRLLGSVDAAGNARSVQYVSASVTTVADPDGNATEYTYNQDQHVTREKDALGNVVEYTWDADFNKTAITDALGAVGFSYDQNGNVLSRADQNSSTTRYTYDSAGNLLTVTEPDGAVTVYGYDSRSNLVAVTDTTGSTTRYAYDDKGRLTKLTDAAGGTTTLAYDTAGNLVRITDPAGAVMTMAYDATGNMIVAADPAGVSTCYAYDALNRLVRLTDAAGNSTAYEYDALGNRTGETDANGNATRLEYDHKGRVTTIIDALGQATRIAYAEAGCPSCGGADQDKPASLTDANGNTTSFSYDALGRLVSETDPLGNVTRYGYDAKGNVISRTDAEGRTIAYDYDKLGRLTGKSYPDGTAASFAYDVKGRLVRAANQHIAYQMEYDAAGRLLAVTDSDGRTVSYEYDVLGNRVKMTSLEGRAVAYSYDEANRLTRIESLAGAFAFGYDLPGRRTSLAYPNGVATSYAYDSLGNLTEILTKGGKAKKTDLLAAFTYTLDNIGNRLTRSALDLHQHGTRHEYDYDPVYRLLEALPVKLEGKDKLLPNQAEVFAYDPVGNRLAGPKTADTYVHNQSNQLLEGPKYTYQYDKNGNMTGKIGFDEEGKYVSWAYEYDFENRLAKATRMDAGESKVVTFKYDPFGRRIEKRVDELEGQDVRTYAYVYDNEDIIIELLTKTEGGKERTEITRYLHGLGIDEPLAVEQNGAFYYYHADGLGSITSLTDAKGQEVETYNYSSFGIPKHHGNHIKQPYTYTGREWDGETGLYFYRARYYEPVAGRFVARDPIGFAGGDVNLYGYVMNNPLNWADSWGLYHCVGGANCDFTQPMDSALECFDRCTDRDTAITGGRGNRTRPNSSHGRGEACDVGRNSNPDLSRDDAEQCFAQCFTNGYGQEEGNGPNITGTHFHFQLNAVPGGKPGFGKGIQPYMP